MQPKTVFPARPRTDDEWCTRLLELMSVDGARNVFLLGSFARYVTIYAQQVRALNLVAALAKSGRLSSNSRVGVVGGGIAGMTAAAAAATLGVAKVSVLERDSRVMRIQRNCEKRFVHPHIYDWPAPGATDPDAQLPLMNWQANSAAQVVSQLDEAWKKVKPRNGAQLEAPRCDVRQLAFVQDTLEAPRLILEGKEHEFDVLILAIGFGLEHSEFGYSYWSDDDVGAAEHETDKKSWLVSGVGDGALTDLMRLLIRDFRHENVLAAVNEATRAKVGDLLLEAESGNRNDRQRAFAEAVDKVDPDLRQAIQFRSVGKVFLNDRTDALLEPQSSILNRLICAWLLKNGRFEVVQGELVECKRVACNVATGGNSVQLVVRFANGSTHHIDRLVQRHGPNAPLKCDAWLAPIATRTTRLREVWQSALQKEDWTREPRYGDTFGSGVKLRVDFGNEIGTVVVVGEREIRDPNLTYRVGQALNRLRVARATDRYAPDRELSTRPIELRMEELLASPAQFERAVRALCSTEIAVFDVTGHESAVMLLLGLRSAVRRGVTVTVSQDERAVIPFNLVSLNPVRTNQGELVGNIANAIQSGITSLITASNRYLDLPAYDPLRSLGEDYRLRGPEQEILVLRWFNDQYAERVGDPIVHEHLVDQYGADTRIVTIADSSSPQLVEQRLYAALRRTRVCVADWTGCRPSVFFEIGVRLAVSEHHPIFILCEQSPANWSTDHAQAAWPGMDDPWLTRLEALFGLTRFTPSNPEPLRERIESYRRDPTEIGLVTSLSPGRTFAVVCEALDRTREPGGQAVESLLLESAELLAGSAVDEGDVPVLYGHVLKEQVRKAAVEHTMAAWYYYLGRYRIAARIASGEIRKDDPELSTLERIGRNLNGRIRNAAEFNQFRPEILAMLKTISSYRKGA